MRAYVPNMFERGFATKNPPRGTPVVDDHGLDGFRLETHGSPEKGDRFAGPVQCHPELSAEELRPVGIVEFRESRPLRAGERLFGSTGLE